jgi:transposase-like protein
MKRTTTPEQREAIVALLREGRLSSGQIALKVGVSRNVIAGIVDRSREDYYAERRAKRVAITPPSGPASTTFSRLDALHAKFDAVVAELAANKDRHHIQERPR